MTTIATDLDRTLFPNGKQDYDDSMPRFKRLVESNGIPLIYVTGRNIDQIKEGIAEYDPPLPHYAVAHVGTKVYQWTVDGPKEDQRYIQFIKDNTKNWNVEAFKNALKDDDGLRLQDDFNQNEFKLSYFVDQLDQADAIVERTVSTICTDINIIYSVDETIGQGLLDILPKRANKMEALEFVRQEMGAPMSDVIYAGDSGNDIIPLTFGYRAILVANATDEVRAKVESIAREKGVLDKIHFANGDGNLNGNYVSGILEGLAHFGVADA